MKKLNQNGKKSTAKKIDFGTVELDADEFDPKYVKEKITIWLDENVVDAFRERARDVGGKYQTLINQVLRNAAFPKDSNQNIFNGVITSRKTVIESIQDETVNSKGIADLLSQIQKLAAVSPELISMAEERKRKKQA